MTGRPVVVLWAFTDGRRGRDDFGRPRSPSGRAALRAVAARVPCGPGIGCRPVTAADGTTGCTGCGRGWSVSHTGHRVVVASSDDTVGVDVEPAVRCSPAAFRLLARDADVRVPDAVGWTRAEALWKAMGRASRRPRTAELPLPAPPGPPEASGLPGPPNWSEDLGGPGASGLPGPPGTRSTLIGAWTRSTDGRWDLLSGRLEALVWSVAVPAPPASHLESPPLVVLPGVGEHRGTGACLTDGCCASWPCEDRTCRRPW